MAGQGLCCGSLEQPKALMKMGLSVILIGHVNFMLAALVQGVVLRHINFQKHHRALEYAVSTVVALTSGLVGIIVGVLTIVLAKNKKNRCLTWCLFVLSLTSAVSAGVAAIGLCVAVAMTIKHNGRILLSHCRFPDAIGYSSVTNECPFDPTRIYSTTLILWLPLIVTSVVQLVFSSRCFAACISFLELPCCPHKKRSRSYGRAINVVKPLEAEPRHCSAPRTNTPLSTQNPQPPSRTSKTASHHSAPLVRYTDSPTRYSDTRSHHSEPTRTHHHAPRQLREGSRQQSQRPPPPQYVQQSQRPPPPQYVQQSQRPPPPQYVPRKHLSLPPSERQTLHKPAPRRERSQQDKTTRTGTQQRPPEEHQLLNRGPLERGTKERSSFWV